MICVYEEKVSRKGRVMMESEVREGECYQVKGETPIYLARGGVTWIKRSETQDWDLAVCNWWKSESARYVSVTIV